MLLLDAQGDPDHRSIEDLVDEMVAKGVDYTMVRCGLTGAAELPDAERANVRETETFSRIVESRYRRAAGAAAGPSGGAHRLPRCQNLLLATSSADSYVLLDDIWN